MEHRDRISRAEAALERLLQRIDAAVDEYRQAVRTRPTSSERIRRDDTAAEDDMADDDGLDLYWEAWWALPFSVRDWLLWVAPGWWALPAGVFRRLLLTTAELIVWRHMPAQVALRRAAAQLRLPPPRPGGWPARAPGGAMPALPRFRRMEEARRSRPVRALRAAPRRLRIAQPRRPPVGRGGGFVRTRLR
jgi:hypothetical protein